jgi:hypothetical protein
VLSTKSCKKDFIVFCRYYEQTHQWWRYPLRH